MNYWRSYDANYLRDFLKYNSQIKTMFNLIKCRPSEEIFTLYDLSGQYEEAKFFKLNGYTYLIFLNDYIAFKWKNDKFSNFECNIALDKNMTNCLLIDIGNMSFNENKSPSNAYSNIFNNEILFKMNGGLEKSIVHPERDLISYMFWKKHSEDKYSHLMEMFLENTFYIDKKCEYVYIYLHESETVLIMNTILGGFISWYKMFHIGRSATTNIFLVNDIDDFSDDLFEALYKIYGDDNKKEVDPETISKRNERMIYKIATNSTYGACCNPRSLYPSIKINVPISAIPNSENNCPKDDFDGDVISSWRLEGSIKLSKDDEDKNDDECQS